jgi:hypothetical protein
MRSDCSGQTNRSDMNVETKNDWELVPFTKVGAFKLGSELTFEFIKKHNLEMWPIESNTQDEFSYYIGGTDSFLTTDGDVIKNVSCRDECNYKGVNLIGRPLEEVEILLQSNAVHDDYMIEHDVYLIDELGLMVWVKDGLVSIIDCSIYIDPDEI